jgi:hypothetical protein
MKYRSKFEARFNLLTGGKLEYEQDKVKYTIPESQHTYLPDFSIPGTNIRFELKGIFDSASRSKMLLVKKQHPELRFIMVFYRANCPINRGSKTTYESWCDKNGLEYMSITQAQELIKQHSPKSL